MMHIKKYPKDTKAGRYLTRLLDQRRHMLNYLVERDYHRYKWICTDYGIPEIHAKAMHRRNFGMC
jgi:ribosomal protein S15P/S13E